DLPGPTADEMWEALRLADAAFASWRKTPFADRASGMRRAAEGLREGRGRYARLMMEEMGKPIAAAEAEIDKCAWNCEFYAEHAGTFLGRQDVPTDASRSFIRYDPLGPILAVMPWNFPFWQLFRSAAPALMAGTLALLNPDAT